MSHWWERLRREAQEFGFQWRPTAIAALFTLILLLPLYHQGQWFYTLLDTVFGKELARTLRGYGLTGAVLLRFLPPFALILLMRQSLKDFGLGLGKIRVGLRLCALFYLLYIPCFVFLMFNESFRNHYSGVITRYEGWPDFLQQQIISIFIFMAASEFLFRGFLLFGMKKYYGPFAATLIALIPYVYGHRGKAEIEALGSFPIGLALSYLALKTESIWYGVLLHATIAIGFNAVLFALG